MDADAAWVGGDHWLLLHWKSSPEQERAGLSLFVRRHGATREGGSVATYREERTESLSKGTLRDFREQGFSVEETSWGVHAHRPTGAALSVGELESLLASTMSPTLGDEGYAKLVETAQSRDFRGVVALVLTALAVLLGVPLFWNSVFGSTHADVEDGMEWTIIDVVFGGPLWLLAMLMALTSRRPIPIAASCSAVPLFMLFTFLCVWLASLG